MPSGIFAASSLKAQGFFDQPLVVGIDAAA